MWPSASMLMMAATAECRISLSFNASTSVVADPSLVMSASCSSAKVWRLAGLCGTRGAGASPVATRFASDNPLRRGVRVDARLEPLLAQIALPPHLRALARACEQRPIDYGKTGEGDHPG